jgi:LEA14-like dessication related protein
MMRGANSRIVFFLIGVCVVVILNGCATKGKEPEVRSVDSLTITSVPDDDFTLQADLTLYNPNSIGG